MAQFIDTDDFGKLPFPFNELQCQDCEEIFAVNLECRYTTKGNVNCPNCGRDVEYEIYAVMVARGEETHNIIIEPDIEEPEDEY